VAVVSVVIPCYRQAHFLPRAVRSVLDQTFTDVEAVIIDDGSPDQPLSHLGDLARDRRVVFLQQENAGVGAARNAGVNASHGAFLNFLDADDWLAPEFCERLLPVFTESESLGFVYCDMHHVYEDTAPQNESEEYSVGRSRRIVSGNILPSLLVGGYFSPQTVLVRRTALDQVGLFDPTLGGHADWDLWLRIAASGFPVRYVDEQLVYYRVHKDSMSRNVDHMRSTRLQTLRKLLGRFPDVVAGAIDELCRTADEQFAANRFLQDQLAEAVHARKCAGEPNQILAEIDPGCYPTQYWQQEVERLKNMQQRFDAYFQESQAWISTLNEANKWHQQQAEHWRRESERLANEGKGQES